MDKTNTPDELVDVVNDKDEIVGQSTKSEVNSNPQLIHREVAVLVHDTKGKIVIQQRSRNKTVMPLYWIISAAGHVPSGMDPEAAAHMELKQELGFDADLKFYVKELLHFPNETHFAYGYIAQIPDNTKIKIDPSETESYRFVNSQELDGMLKSGEKIEEYSLSDFRDFFSGKLT